MTENRRISTRYRGEPPLKKRALTPPPPPPPAPPPPVEPVEEGLPIKLREGQPLPTLPEPQDADLSTKAFQSVSESGVLAAAIERSRQRWMVDGVFDRYWTKPSKKKSMGEASNPAKETMTRLGNCTMIIEPHAFDVTLYTVKELPQAQHNPPPAFPQYSQYPAYVPPFQPPSSGVRVPPQHQYQRKLSQPSLPNFNEGFGQLGSQSGPPVYHGPTPSTAHADQAHSRRQSQSELEGTPKNEGAPHADPVIQMLATRAASDHALKALMKVVASGKASADQLREFQSHIDELNAILKSRKSPNPSAPEPAPQNPPPQRPANTPSNTQIAVGVRIPPLQRPPLPPPTAPTNIVTPTHPPIKTEPNPTPQQPYLMPHPPKPKALTYRPDIHAMVFDFNGTGDRFSIPRHSILDYLPGNTQVLVSFLFIRRGGGLSKKHSYYKDTKSYYQPVTIRLSTHNPRTLEPLARVVAPLDEVRRYMDSVFDKMAPAENVFLATRLPRSKEGEEGGDKLDAATGLLRGEEEVRAVYRAPDSIVPLGV